MNLRVSQTGQIFNGNNLIGYVDENGDVFIYQATEAVKIGNVDHPNEIYGIVSGWMRKN